MQKIRYELPRENKPPKEQFFALRVRQWIMHPEADHELTNDIKAGKYPELECLLK